MLRCASSFVVAAYAQVRLTPHDLRALPQGAFYVAVIVAHFSTFYEFVINEEKDEAGPLRRMSIFHGRRTALMVKKGLTNGAKQTISILPFHGGGAKGPARKRGLCITAEKWSASGESIFQMSRKILDNKGV